MACARLMKTQRTRSAGEGRSPSAGELGSVCGQLASSPGELSQPSGGNPFGDFRPRSYLDTQRTRSAGEGRSPSAGELGSVCGQLASSPGELSQPSGGNPFGDFRPRSRIFHRLAAICVLALVGWLGIGRAEACVKSSNWNFSQCADQGTAFAAAMQIVAHRSATCTNVTGPTLSSSKSYAVNWSGCPGNASGGNSATWVGGSCSDRADTVAPGLRGFGGLRNASVTCESGCQVGWFNNGDGTYTGKASAMADLVCSGIGDSSMCDQLGDGYYWNGASLSCELPVVECPPGQSPQSNNTCGDDPCPAGMALGPDGTCINEKNECPAGEVKSPTGQCLPGEGRCAQGEARGKDGTCKRDSDGDGVPDNEDDNPDNDDPTESFSGGDNCNSPPSCSGGPIDCGMARIQWRIECNTRRNETIAGGACNAMPICTGEKCNAMEYSQLLQQWKAACALEKLASGEGGGGGNDGGGDGSQPAWTRVDGMNSNPGAGAGEGDAPTVRNRTFNTDDLDQGGFGGGGSCPGFAAGGGGVYSNAFMTHLANPPALWCNYIAYIKAVMVLIGSVAAVFIIARS